MGFTNQYQLKTMRLQIYKTIVLIMELYCLLVFASTGLFVIDDGFFRVLLKNKEE